MTHRLVAYVRARGAGCAGLAPDARAASARLRRFGLGVAGVALWQLASGLSQRRARLAAGRRRWRTPAARGAGGAADGAAGARARAPPPLAPQRAPASPRSNRLRRIGRSPCPTPSPAPPPAPRSPSRARQFYALTKPRVVQLIVFCAVIGMLLAVPGLPDWRAALAGDRRHLAGGRRRGGLQLPGRAAHRRASMARTAWRPTAKGELTQRADAGCSRRCCARPAARCCTGWVNPLTMWLTFATFVGYAVVYTVLLKPLTPQNIVIGGASGAMPPVLGWAAMRGEVGPEALMLCLIIFLWTPPHFWALALYRAEDYRRAGLPMLPVTHGNEFTRLQVLLYTLVLFAATLLPFVYGMSGWLYLAAARGAGRRASSATPGGCGAATATRWRARPSASRSVTCRCCSPRCWWTTT